MSFWSHTIFENVRTRVLVIDAGQIVILPAVGASTACGETVWRLPGGSLEPGESLADCATREVREETGLEVAVGRGAFLKEWVAPTYCQPDDAPENGAGFGLEVFFYAALRGARELRAEHPAAPPRWVDLAELAELPLWPLPLKSLAAALAAGLTPAGAHSFVDDFEDPQAAPGAIAW